MKITILGTGSIYSKSNCTGILIDNDTLVDVGPGVVKFLLKNNFNLANIKNIVLSHLHTDHLLDFLILINNLEVLDDKHRIDVYGPRNTESKILGLMKLLDNRFTDDYLKQYYNFHTIEDKTTIKLAHHTLESCQVIHGNVEAYAFLVDNKLGITGDSSLCESIKYLAGHSTILICDCSKEVGDVMHMGINDLLSLQQLNNQLKIIPTHFRDETKEVLRKMHLPNLPIIEDGYSFNLD
ncbi:MAG: MBL fold metallo-hydrolase [Candidatus Saccharibacteria bacterium]|nr:MBL fold metallo-hydrolase [Candidatus Saccharibacteria bacterium]